ncbi:hypothetical protein BUZ14_01170 [Staphylococcus gallinarum]|uniref:YrhK domain-containing protein n=1 Tax=Staphylococcus gallinarum TaxID=1293 RepID=A0A3A0W893_STAGA|nr:hypothetical protein BUZ14_01170 [Staphylococcus gallinarum]
MANTNKFNKKFNSPDLNFNHNAQPTRLTMIYKALYQLNDIILGLVFLVGSFLFFSSTTTFSGTVLFVIGSIKMTIRPLIAFTHDLHLAFKYKS